MTCQPTNAQYTPGPWSVWPLGEIGPDHCRIAEVYNADPSNDDPEAEANAHLIAAAPELLAACKYINQHGFSVEAWDLILGAVAKAEGRHEADHATPA